MKKILFKIPLRKIVELHWLFTLDTMYQPFSIHEYQISIEKIFSQ